jgi:hypothetical protein
MADTHPHPLSTLDRPQQRHVEALLAGQVEDARAALRGLEDEQWRLKSMVEEARNRLARAEKTQAQTLAQMGLE